MLGGALARFTLHIDLVAAFHDDEQCHERKGDEADENFPHDRSPEFVTRKAMQNAGHGGHGRRFVLSCRLQAEPYVMLAEENYAASS
jgi:hypothetical protein